MHLGFCVSNILLTHTYIDHQHIPLLSLLLLLDVDPTHSEAKGAGEEWTCAFCAAVNVGRFDRGKEEILKNGRQTQTRVFIFLNADSCIVHIHTPINPRTPPTPHPKGARGGGGKLPPEFERQAVEFRAPLPGRRRRGRTLSSSMGMMGAGGGGSGLGAWVVIDCVSSFLFFPLTSLPLLSH